MKRIQQQQEKREEEYKLIKELHETNRWPIMALCAILEINRAAYYKWLNRKPTQHEQENEEILEEIRAIANENNCLFGCRKMTLAMNKNRENPLNHKRIYRLMSIHGLESVYRRKRRSTWRKSDPDQTAENVLHREFNATRPNEKWGTDITEIAVPGTGKKLYVSTIVDFYGNYPVAVHVSQRNDTELVEKTLTKALEAAPGATPLFHSDRGFQYTRTVFQTRLADQGMTPSMSRVGRCIDNGLVEGFQGQIKDMLWILHPGIQTVKEMEEAIYKTYKYYKTEYPLLRYHGKTSEEVWKEGLLVDNPEQYPIQPNLQIKNFWKRIEAKKAINK